FTYITFTPLLHHHYLHSFPTRRSSDLILSVLKTSLRFLAMSSEKTSFNTCSVSPCPVVLIIVLPLFLSSNATLVCTKAKVWISSDRKSTRLNSSHVSISYAVFCLKKQN